VDTNQDIESGNDAQQEINNAADQCKHRAKDTRQRCNNEYVEAANKVKYSVQQVSDHSLDGANGTTSEEENNSHYRLQNSKDKGQESVDGCTEAGEVHDGQVNLSSCLELHDTGRHNSSDLNDDVRDSIGGAGVTRQARQLGAQRLDVSGRVGDDGDDGLEGNIISIARTTGAA